MAKITPVEFPLNEGTANVLFVKSLEFESTATNCTLYYELRQVSEFSAEENVPPLVKTLRVGNVHMTEEAFAAWGQDNSYLDDYVADYLGVTIVSES